MDRDRIKLAVAFLSEAAQDWWMGTAVAVRPTTWLSFVAALRQRFQHITTAEMARTKLRQLQQGKSSVADYVAAFRRLLISIPTMDEESQLSQFLYGLRPAIATQLRIHAVTTVGKAIELATRIGGIGEYSAASAPSSSPTSSAPMDLSNIEGLEGETAATDATTATTDGVAGLRTELQQLIAAMREGRHPAPASSSRGGRGGAGAGAGNRGGRGGFQRRFGGPPRIPHLTPVQVQEYMAAGKCFGCGSTEHNARTCPTRKQGEDGRVTWQQPK